MNLICLDANVVAKLVLEFEDDHEIARQLIDESLSHHTYLIAPPVFESELDSILRKLVHKGAMTVDVAEEAYNVLDEMPIWTLTHPGLRRRAREIAERFSQKYVYDATYAALAELHQCDFWTADYRFYHRVQEVLAYVKYLPNYRSGAESSI